MSFSKTSFIALAIILLARGILKCIDYMNGKIYETKLSRYRKKAEEFWISTFGYNQHIDDEWFYRKIDAFIEKATIERPELKLPKKPCKPEKIF